MKDEVLAFRTGFRVERRGQDEGDGVRVRAEVRVGEAGSGTPPRTRWSSRLPGVRVELQS